MAITPFLAMTAAEIQAAPVLPERFGWMACHFSPYGTGLANLPKDLPKGSLLILNDRIPIQGHDPERIRCQLEEAVERLGCYGLLLDFQRPDCGETASLVRHLSGGFPGMLAVSEGYAAHTDAGVFLPPPPHYVPLAEYTAPWAGRNIWLELAMDAETITVTREGASISRLPSPVLPEPRHREDTLHCHYRTLLREESAEFTLWQTADDLKDLLRDAEAAGISHAVGLYQELAGLL